MLLEGLQLPLTTPFHADGRLNLPKLEANVTRYSKTPVAGLVTLSDAGEPTMLSDEETRQILRSVAEAAAAEKVLVAGCSRDSLVGTLDLAEFAANAGFDAVLVKPPSLFSVNGRPEDAKSLMTYFRALADRSALPVVLYSTGLDPTEAFQTDVIAELAGHPQVIGLVDCAGRRGRLEKIIGATAGFEHEATVTAVFAAVTRRMQVRKEAAGEWIAVDALKGGMAALAVAPPKAVARTRRKKVGFQLLAGSTARMLDGFRAGAAGAMPAFAASAPQACYEVWAAWKDGDEDLAEEKQRRLERVAERIEEQLGVAGIKFGCDLNGYFGGAPRSPQLPLTGEERREIEALMHEMRN